MGKKFCNENIHWADFSAQKTIEKFPNEKIYNVASGITPSGFIHVGNFREVITTELVRRALEDKGQKTKFIYSWDSYDRLRKIPDNISKEFEKYIGQPVGFVKCPFKKEKSYADNFIKTFEEDVKNFGFEHIVFQKQHKLQTSGIYFESIKKVLQNKKKIIEILNKYRSEDKKLDETYWPITIYDGDTLNDINEIISYDNENTLIYKNEKGIEKKLNFKENPKVKLKWKCDWPMRWDFYKISFEPGGKDHSTPGSSYTVGSDIIKEIFQREAPEYTMYDFVKLKGENKKISSSSGGLRLKEVSKIYTDELLLFIFSSCRPSKEISLSFDLDVLKIYEDFYKIERIYYNIEEDKNEKSLINKKRIYELCQYKNQETQKKIPYQIDFRHLTTIIQVNDFDFEKVERFYKENIKTEFEKKRLKQMFNCAKNWIENYAPDDMKFKINETFPKVQISGKEKEFLLELKKVVENLNEEIEIYNLVKDFSSKNNLDIKEIFKLCYKIIISKNKGPKITSLIKNSKDKVLKILDNLK